MKQIDESKLTPMMKQYYEIKKEYMDYILFYRLGDFYEMFFDDAVIASRELEITLTGRNCGLEERAPLCGIPHHAVDTYLKKLVDKGIKVAICEQVEDPATAKGIVKREVIRVITPGTVVDPEMLEDRAFNFVASICQEANRYGLAYCDITTGMFKVTQLDSENQMIDELLKVSPSEVIYSDAIELSSAVKEIAEQQDISLSPFLEHVFGEEPAQKTIERVLNIFSVESLGLNEWPVAMRASGALISYIEETAKVPLNHITHIDHYLQSKYMVLDKFTRRNLELTQTMRQKEKRGSLLWVLDKTSTAMGARKLRSWLEEPLLDVEMIKKRQDAVEVLLEDLLLRSDLTMFLKQIYDLERLVSKLVYGNINPRDFIALKQSLAVLPELKMRLSDISGESLSAIFDDIDTLTEVTDYIEKAIVDEPPFLLKDGGYIKTSYNEDLKAYREAITNGKTWLLNIENREKETTGIKNLKVGFNKVFGYYIEISKGSAKLAPETYVRKQTLANAERFITPELKEIEETLLGAEEKGIRLESVLFTQIKENVMQSIDRIQKTASAVAELDVLIAYAEVSYRYGYKRPKVSQSQTLSIKNGRHPVIERIFKETAFVPNDTLLDQRDNQFYIITGPNMAGKSTYLRQVALITLMAQIGCFVPADKAEIGVVDRIFTRVGASDDLSQGQSTFMVEMNELANILNNATHQSLIILDEIGRGTSTYDGLSIAWSVVEYIAKNSGKTLFATHYHELTELEGLVEGVKNYRIAVKEVHDDIIFLRKIEKGGANQSYGIQVAKLAGVPQPVIERAKDILSTLEANDINRNMSSLNASYVDNETGDKETTGKSTKGSQSTHAPETPPKPMLISDDNLDRLISDIKIDVMTPIEAMNTLYEIVTLYRNKKGE